MVEMTTSALTTASWVGSFSGISLSETFAFPLQIGGTWEMMNLANAQWSSFSGFDASQMNYVCSRGGTFYTQQIPIADNNNFGDYTGFWAANTSSPYKAYVTVLKNFPPNAIRFLKTQDPCPATGTPSWSLLAFTIPNFPDVLDIPKSLYDYTYDRRYVLFDGQYHYSGGMAWVNSIVMARMNVDDTVNYAILDNAFNSCPAIQMHSLMNPVGVADTSGDVHVVFLDNNSTYTSITFHGSTFSWDCSTVQYVGSVNVQPHGMSCTMCSGTPNYPDVGAGCLKENVQPSLAIDRTATPNTLMVAFETAGTGTYSGKTYTQWARSLNNGLSWTGTGFTGTTDAKPALTAAYTPTLGGFKNMFGTQTVHATGGGNVAQVVWTTSDAGATWSGVYTSSNRFPTNQNFYCYWGDYNGAVGDLISGSGSTNSMYFNYEQAGAPGTGTMGIAAFRAP